MGDSFFDNYDANELFPLLTVPSLNQLHLQPPEDFLHPEPAEKSLNPQPLENNSFHDDSIDVFLNREDLHQALLL